MRLGSCLGLPARHVADLPQPDAAGAADPDLAGFRPDPVGYLPRLLRAALCPGFHPERHRGQRQRLCLFPARDLDPAEHVRRRVRRLPPDRRLAVRARRPAPGHAGQPGRDPVRPGPARRGDAHYPVHGADRGRADRRPAGPARRGADRLRLRRRYRAQLVLALLRRRAADQERGHDVPGPQPSSFPAHPPVGCPAAGDAGPGLAAGHCPGRAVPVHRRRHAERLRRPLPELQRHRGDWRGRRDGHRLHVFWRLRVPAAERLRAPPRCQEGTDGQMKSGVLINHISQPLGGVIERARLAEKCGADSIWLTQTAGQREIGMLASALAANTENVQIGLAVQPIYAHPPVVAAQTALTLDELSGGRLILGLGVGHRVMGEWMMGASYTPQAAAMGEYLTIVRSLVTEGQVNFAGRWYSGHAAYAAPSRPDLPLYPGALGPRMLELAGGVADGVVIYMSSPSYLREQVMPRLQA